MNPIKIQSIDYYESRNKDFRYKRNFIYNEMLNTEKPVPSILMIGKHSLFYYDPFKFLKDQVTIFLQVSTKAAGGDFQPFIFDKSGLTVNPSIGSDAVGGIHHYIEKGFFCIERKDVING